MGWFTKDIETMDDLFVHTLQDIYYPENQIRKSLPEMINKATSPELKSGFEQHLRQTEDHIDRLKQVFKQHGAEEKGVTCPAIDGILPKRAMWPAMSLTNGFWMRP